MCIHMCFILFACVAGDKFFWIRNEEFGRETLAGLNPYSIKLLSV